PPSEGPATEAVWNMIVLRLIAFGRCSRGTSVGTSALRAGRSNAPTADATAASAYTGQITVTPANAIAASAAAAAVDAVCVTSSSLFRSHASATTPLII